MASSIRACLGCGAPVPMKGVTGYCDTNPDCRKMKAEIGNLKRRDPDRKCGECGGPLSLNNTTGFCRKTPACEKKSRYTSWNRNYRIKGRKRNNRPASKSSVVVWLLPEDGIIDEFAIELAVTGRKDVALTDGERRIAVQKMLKMHIGPEEMRKRLHVTPHGLNAILADFGYEMIIDTLRDGHYRIFARIDRPKGKIL